MQFGHTREIVGAMRGLEFEACALELFLDVGRALHRGFLGFPYLFEVRELFLECLELLVELGEALG